MSQRVVGYTGEGRSRRRIVVDEGPATAAARHPMAMVERGGVPRNEITAPTGGAGAIERRQLYEAQDDIRAEEARQARIHAPTNVKAATAQISRQRGADANQARLAAQRAVTPPAPPEEEPAVSEAAQPTEAEPVAIGEALEQLAEAATRAAEAWTEKVAADSAWVSANEAVDDAWSLVRRGHGLVAIGTLVEAADRAIEAGVDETVEEDLGQLVVAEAQASVALDGETQVSPVSEPGGDHAETIPAAAPKREAPRPDGLTTFQRRVLDATIKHRGDRRAATAELGVKNYQSIDGALEQAGKKGLLPATLIPLLPARFAKYATVPTR